MCLLQVDSFTKPAHANHESKCFLYLSNEQELRWSTVLQHVNYF